jgi:hypothetical protein
MKGESTSRRLKNQPKMIRRLTKNHHWSLQRKRNCHRLSFPTRMILSYCWATKYFRRKKTSLHWMNRRDRGNGQDGRSGYGHGCGPDAAVSWVVDCRLAAGFHPVAVGCHQEEDFRRADDAYNGLHARIHGYLRAGIRIFHCRCCGR